MLKLICDGCGAETEVRYSTSMPSDWARFKLFVTGQPQKGLGPYDTRHGMERILCRACIQRYRIPITREESSEEYAQKLWKKFLNLITEEVAENLNG